MNCTSKRPAQINAFFSSFHKAVQFRRISSDPVVALSAVSMGYIHTPASVSLDGAAADVKQTSM